MTSSKNWALYATNHRLGKRSEHRLAGARIRQVGAMLEWHLPFGWTATIHVGRVSVKVAVQLPDSNARSKDWVESLFDQEGMFV